MLKFLFIIVAVFWLIPAFFRSVKRLFHMTEIHASDSQNRADGDVTIQNTGTVNKKVADKMGEYIDFTETEE